MQADRLIDRGRDFGASTHIDKCTSDVPGRRRVASWVMESLPMAASAKAAGRPKDTRPLHVRMLPEDVDQRPSWLTVKLPVTSGYSRLKTVMRDLELNTVCEEAQCPNIGECWGQGT